MPRVDLDDKSAEMGGVAEDAPLIVGHCERLEQHAQVVCRLGQYQHTTDVSSGHELFELGGDVTANRTAATSLASLLETGRRWEQPLSSGSATTEPPS